MFGLTSVMVSNKPRIPAIVARYSSSVDANIHFPSSGVVGTFDWGDGSAVITNPTGLLIKTLSADTTVRFEGTISGGQVRMYGGVTHVDDWIEGPTSYSFENARQLVAVPSWLPRSVTSASFMFRDAWVFNQPLPWDTSNVTDMSYMFMEAFSFNQDLSGWCVALIPSKPTNFDFNTPAWVKSGRQPIWGTCP